MMYSKQGGDRFEFFIKKCLLPVLMLFNGIDPLSVVIMDNEPIHYVESNIHLIGKLGSKGHLFVSLLSGSHST